MECIFRTDCKDYYPKDGEVVTLIGPCNPSTYDMFEGGRMYDIQFHGGEKLNVYAGELELLPADVVRRLETVLRAVSTILNGWRITGCRAGNVFLEADVPGGGTFILGLGAEIRSYSCQLYDMLDRFDFEEWKDDMQDVPADRMTEAGEWLKAELRRLIIGFTNLETGVGA